MECISYHQNVNRWEYRTDQYLEECGEQGPFSHSAALPSKNSHINTVPMRLRSKELVGLWEEAVLLNPL